MASCLDVLLRAEPKSDEAKVVTVAVMINFVTVATAPKTQTPTLFVSSLRGRVVELFLSIVIIHK